jgi:hypothetical protein
MNMRNSIFLLIAALAIAMGFNSCSDDVNIGSSISDIHSAIISDSDFVITGQTVKNNHLRSRSSVQLLGKVTAPGYGTLTSDVVTQFMPTSRIDTVGVHGGSDWIDSCFITMRVNSTDVVGDSLAPMRVEIYELSKQLPVPIYTDFDPTDYYDKGRLMGSVAYSASEMARKEIMTQNGVAGYYYEINVPVDVDYARALFDEYKNNPATFATPANFAEFFPGIYITNSYGEGHVMNFYNIEFVAHYRKYEKLTEGTDTIYPNKTQSYLAVTPEIVYNNNVTLTPDASVLDMINAGDAIVMSPAGYEVKVQFPIKDIIDRFKNDTKDALGKINSLTLEIPVEKVPNLYNIAPPKYLLMVKESYRDEFFNKDSLTNNKDAFYAEYNEALKTYTFSGLRDYVLDIINNKSGEPTEADINFVIMPIEVTIYNNSSLTYYYGSSGSTDVITKIAPAISRPRMAKLNLNKASINLVYSKQMLY